MELFGLVLGVLGIVVTLGIAYWQHRKAVTAEAHLQRLVKELPETLLSGVREALAHSVKAAGSSEATPAQTVLATDAGLQTSYADLDGDGRQELLVEVNSGAYSSALLVYGFQNGEFEKIGELFSTTLGGFEIKDFDGDGKLEVRTDEIARRPDLPYVFGLRDSVIHKFESGTFREISRMEMWTEGDLRRIRAMIAIDEAESV